MEISLATPLLSRDGLLGKDPYMLNCYWEQNTGGGRTIVRRPALGPQINSYLPAGTVQGVVHSGILHYVIVNDTLRDATGTSASVPIPGVTSAGLRMDCVTNLTKTDQTNPSFVKSQSQAWLFVGGSFSQVTNANYPSSTVPGAVFLDSTYYVMDKTGMIFGSDLDNCQSWSALNFIKTDQGLGPAVALHSHLNYVVAFCERGTQFFYDAANPAPGSPLSSIQNATNTVGCAHPDSIQSSDGLTFFMSQDKNRGRAFHMIHGLTMRKISTPDIERILERNPFAINRGGYSNLYSMVLKADGHTFYIFNLTDKGLTLAYDLQNDHWAQWNSYDPANPATPKAWQGAVVLYTYSPGTSNIFPFVVPPGAGYCASFGQGDQAGGEQIIFGARTRPLDAGTTVRKVCSELSLLGDTVTATMNVRYSNDYGVTWSAWRGINLGLARKRLTRLGTFVSRVYEFQCVTTAKVRLESMVLPDRNLPAQTQPSGE